MFSEEDLLPISGLQHLAFCSRQCALIHIEQAWQENRLTAEGRVFHERVHEGTSGLEGECLVQRGLRLVSRKLGLYGVADVIEFVRTDSGTLLKTRKGLWSPYPIEYKRGKPKKGNEDRIQLCAQAICLEECFDVDVPEGALFYGRPRRREVVIFTETLRDETARCADEFHDLVVSGNLPVAQESRKCNSCSLHDLCMPESKVNVERYVCGMIRKNCEDNL